MSTTISGLQDNIRIKAMLEPLPLPLHPLLTLSPCEPEKLNKNVKHLSYKGISRGRAPSALKVHLQ